ncbi:hypothetical protein APY04_2352 [Hyphomicrobium sulfonivorans]|uniref:Uncharacterized protein n=1 Tax=Hyphomicrobium sulfonivorans TaxID=121290 RepID=A0A109BDF7_HYPSL|nr:hypothetical protein APY04_2352 [Hyphomicrobium sulfonivorans]
MGSISSAKWTLAIAVRGRGHTLALGPADRMPHRQASA